MSAARARFLSTWSGPAGIGRDHRSGGYHRHGFDDADLSLREWFVEQAERRGLATETDRNGNLWAWWGDPEPGSVAVGSHLDTVPGGGAFDGALGVVGGLLAVDGLRERGVRPRRSVAVVCFTETEGGRFGVPGLGSRLRTGSLDPDAARRLHDEHGCSLAEAVRRAGVDPTQLGPDPVRIATLGAFVELHLEQGREMTTRHPGALVAVGAEIAARGRWSVLVTGRTDHAAATASGDRRDPMIPAATAVLAAREATDADHSVRATVARVRAEPDDPAVIAGAVRFVLDVTSSSARRTAVVVDRILAPVRERAAAQGCTVVVRRESLQDNALLDTGLGLQLSAALDAPVLPSAVGHDAGVLAPSVPSAMVFVRNPSGISHAPEEYLDPDDCVAAVERLTDALQTLV